MDIELLKQKRKDFFQTLFNENKEELISTEKKLIKDYVTGADNFIYRPFTGKPDEELSYWKNHKLSEIFETVTLVNDNHYVKAEDMEHDYNWYKYYIEITFKTLEAA